MRGVSILIACVLAVFPVRANEALDLLEGKDESNIMPAAPTASGGASPTTTAGEGTPGRSWDYGARWQRRLLPLWSPYLDESNPVVQEVSINGLLEGRYENTSIEGEDGSDDEVDDWAVRRLRLGASVRAFYNTEVEGKVVFDDEDYQGVDTLRAFVDVNDHVTVTAGKFRPPFGSEYSTDPALRLTPEMAPLSRQLSPGNTLGGMVSLQAGQWDYALGYFSGDVDKDLPGFDEDGFLLAKLMYTFDGAMTGPGDDPGENPFQRWHFDYVYNYGGADSLSIPMGYEHMVSTGIELSSERLDLLVDLMLANGEASTAWGLTLLGAYWLYEDAVQLVGRFHYADSDEDDGLMLGYGIPSALSDSVQPQAFPTMIPGEELHSFYAGLNFHIFGDYLLLNAGVEYLEFDDSDDDEDTDNSFDAWIWQAGGRIAF